MTQPLTLTDALSLSLILLESVQNHTYVTISGTGREIEIFGAHVVPDKPTFKDILETTIQLGYRTLKRAANHSATKKRQRITKKVQRQTATGKK